jgi:hypothetical protein
MIIEDASLDGNDSCPATRKICSHSSSVDRNEIDRVCERVRPSLDILRQSESMQDRQARWVDAIAANFFARKSFALNQSYAQSGGGAERRATRPSRAASDNGNIDNIHLFAV